MGFLDKLLHRPPTAQTAPGAEAAVCLHTALLPRWGSVADMGQEEKTTSYHCDACGKEFTPEEAQSLRASEAERLRGLSQPPPPN